MLDFNDIIYALWVEWKSFVMWVELRRIGVAIDQRVLIIFKYRGGKRCLDFIFSKAKSTHRKIVCPGY